MSDKTAKELALELTLDNRRLATHLKEMLFAWDYNGGGDRWTRECLGDDIQAARKALEEHEKEHGEIKLPE